MFVAPAGSLLAGYLEQQMILPCSSLHLFPWHASTCSLAWQTVLHCTSSSFLQKRRSQKKKNIDVFLLLLYPILLTTQHNLISNPFLFLSLDQCLFASCMFYLYCSINLFVDWEAQRTHKERKKSKQYENEVTTKKLGSSLRPLSLFFHLFRNIIININNINIQPSFKHLPTVSTNYVFIFSLWKWFTVALLSSRIKLLKW